MSTYRLCAIGNSHLAAAKLGWDQIAVKHDDFEIDFFAFAPGTSDKFGSNVDVARGSIVATSPKLKQAFELTAGTTRIHGPDYSAFITFGLGTAGPSRITRRICAEHRPFGYSSDGVQLISIPCLVAACDDLLSSERMLAPFRALRAISDAPVLYQSIPAPMASIVADPNYADDPCSVVGLLDKLRPIFDQRCQEAGGGELYTYVPQPGETIDFAGLTKDEFIIDGVGFKAFLGRPKARNVSHGNARYGAVVMERAIRLLRDTPGLRPH